MSLEQRSQNLVSTISCVILALFLATTASAEVTEGHAREQIARLRDEWLNGEIFYTLREAQVIIESWRRHYNLVRPHQSLGYRPPAPEGSCPASPHGLSRAMTIGGPRSVWQNDHRSTNIQPGALDGG